MIVHKGTYPLFKHCIKCGRLIEDIETYCYLCNHSGDGYDLEDNDPYDEYLEVDMSEEVKTVQMTVEELQYYSLVLQIVGAYLKENDIKVTMDDIRDFSDIHFVIVPDFDDKGVTLNYSIIDPTSPEWKDKIWTVE